MRNDVIAQQTGAELRAFIERIETLEEEKAEVAAQIKEVFAEMKGRGFLVMPVRAVLRERRQGADKAAEDRAIIDMYRAALGMDD